MAQLPQEVFYLTKRKKILQLIIGTISLFLAFNAVLYIFLINNPHNFSAAIIIEKWNLIQKIKGKEISCLLIGDSSGNQGLVTDLFPNPESTYNLCTIGDFILYDDVLMLKYLIDNQTIPKKIVIVHVYDVWERNLNKEGFQHTPVLNFSNTSHLDFVSLSKTKQLELFRDKFFPIYSQKETVSQLILNPQTLLFSHYFTKNGFMPQEEVREKSVLSDVEGHKKAVFNNTFELSKENEKSFEYLITLIEKYKIPTYIIESPLAQELFDDADYKTYNYSIQEKLKSIAAKSDYLNFIAFDKRTFPASMMQSADHVTKKGAIIYTNNVVEILKNK